MNRPPPHARAATALAGSVRDPSSARTDPTSPTAEHSRLWYGWRTPPLRAGRSLRSRRSRSRPDPTPHRAGASAPPAPPRGTEPTTSADHASTSWHPTRASGRPGTSPGSPPPDACATADPTHATCAAGTPPPRSPPRPPPQPHHPTGTGCARAPRSTQRPPPPPRRARRAPRHAPSHRRPPTTPTPTSATTPSHQTREPTSPRTRSPTAAPGLRGSNPAINARKESSSTVPDRPSIPAARPCQIPRGSSASK